MNIPFHADRSSLKLRNVIRCPKLLRAVAGKFLLSTLSKIMLLTATLVGLTSCSTQLPTLRYRLTVVIDTPAGQRTGTGVFEISSFITAGFAPSEARGLHQKLRGEAVAVPLPDGNHLFAALKWNRASEPVYPMLMSSFADQLPASAVAVDERGDRNWRLILSLLQSAKGVRSVDPKFYPVLVYFEDPTNPSTIVTSLAIPQRNTPAPNARLVTMTIEITNAPITRQIESLLPWLSRAQNQYFDPEVRSSPLGMFPDFRLISYESLSRN